MRSRRCSARAVRGLALAPLDSCGAIRSRCGMECRWTLAFFPEVVEVVPIVGIAAAAALEQLDVAPYGRFDRRGAPAALDRREVLQRLKYEMVAIASLIEATDEHGRRSQRCSDAHGAEGEARGGAEKSHRDRRLVLIKAPVGQHSDQGALIEALAEAQHRIELPDADELGGMRRGDRLQHGVELASKI